jgi:ribonuclease-3
MFILNELEEKIGYKFIKIEFLRTALTHSSFANEANRKSYERLEFLGDSILGFVASEYIFNKFPDYLEGKLTRVRSALVCEKTIKKFSEVLEVGKFLKLSKGESSGGGRERSSILADVFEAIIAAIFLDGGIVPAREFVLKFIVPELEIRMFGDGFRDYKTEIQEIMQEKFGVIPRYVLIDEVGPEHEKFFTSELLCKGKSFGRGIGCTKKSAEQAAAKAALASFS